MMPIYVLEVPELHCVKIGFSARWGGAEKRLRTCQTYCPAQVRLLAELPGGEADERWLHKKLKAVHIRGEWFIRTNELRRLLAVISKRYEADDYETGQCEWRAVVRSSKISAKRWNPHRWRRMFGGQSQSVGVEDPRTGSWG